MRCERCHGLGRILVSVHAGGPSAGFDVVVHTSPNGSGVEVVCTECNGSGIAHCCDGLCAQVLQGDGFAKW